MAKKKDSHVVELGPTYFEGSTFFNDGQDSDVKIVGVSTLEDTTDPQNTAVLFNLSENYSIEDDAGVFRPAATPNRTPVELRATVRVTDPSLNTPLVRQVTVRRVEDASWQDPGFFFTAHIRLKKFSAGWRIHVTAVQFYKDAANADSYVVSQGESATFYL